MLKATIGRRSSDNLNEIRLNEKAIQALGYPKELVFYIAQGKPVIEFVLTDTIKKIRKVRPYKFKGMIDTEYRMSIGDIQSDITGKYSVSINKEGISLEKIEE